MNKLLQQSLAITKSECLRMATSPAWAILLFLWTLVCGLFFQIVINYAAANALPVGETPMSYFFRTAPFLLPLLLIIFIPQLTMDVVAGRRERGRMEHLLISGLKPGALIIGAFLAICCLLLSLIIPPIIFHGIVAIHADPDFGKTASALFSLLFIGASIASLGLCISCWAPNRLSASLIAVSIGITWWIIDVFGQQIDQGDNWESWRASLALALTVYDSASGLVEPRIFIGFGILTLALLYIARCGLDWHRYPRSRIMSATMGFIIGIICIAHFQTLNTRWDFTSYRTHSLNKQTLTLTRELIQQAHIQVTVSTTPAIRSSPIDGPIYERCHNMFKRLSNEGIAYHEMDPALDPNAAMQLSRECNLDQSDWQHPLVIIKYLNNHVVLKNTNLAAYEQIGDQITLKALRCEGSFLAALQYFKDGHLKQVAWLNNEHVRPLQTQVLHQRDRSIQSAYQRLISDGYSVQQIKSISEANDQHHLLIIPGLINDLSEDEVTHIINLLQNGTSILMLIDGHGHQQFKQHQSSLLNDFGINLYQGLAVELDEQKNPSPLFNRQFISTSGPFKVIHQDHKQFTAAMAQPMRVTNSTDKQYTTKGYLLNKQELHLLQKSGVSEIEDPVYLIAISESATPKTGHLGVISCVDSFSDAHIHRGSNGLSLSLLSKHLLRRPIVDELPPQAVQAHRFELSTVQKLMLIWCIGIGLPLLSGGIGALVAWRRRRV